MKFLKHFSIHYSFILLILFSIFSGKALLIIEYFLCLILHECFHGIVAKKRGYEIGKIKLMATGASLEAESDEFSFKDEIFIALAGPIFNLCVAILIIMLWWIFPEIYILTEDLFVINLAIFMFNILPIFPLDGGRILLAFFSRKNERRFAVKVSKTITYLFCLLLILLFIISLFYIPFFSFGYASIMLFISVGFEDKNAIYKRVTYLLIKSKKLKKYGIEERTVYVDKNYDNLDLLKMVDAKFYTKFVLVDENFNVDKIVYENELY